MMTGQPSSLALHRQAEALMAQADVAAGHGDPDGAARYRLAAGRIEAEVFALIPASRPKTRRITAISATALYLRGYDFAAAAAAARTYLAEPDISADTWAARELKAIARDAQALAKLAALVSAGRGPEAKDLAAQLGKRARDGSETAQMASHLLTRLG